MFADICDELAGRYPKNFKFTGWHPQCRCTAIPILKTEDEFLDSLDEESTEKSENEVTDVPDNFKRWLENNEERAKRRTSMPYFIKDNEKFLPTGYKNLYAMKTPYDTYAEYEAAMKYNKKYANFTPEIIKNNRELNEVLPVIQGKIMNFTEADKGHTNPHFTDPDGQAEGYWHNCQTCTMTYELRRRGFDLQATPNPVLKGYKRYRNFEHFCVRKNTDWRNRFLTADGKRANYEWSVGIKDTGLDKLKFIEGKTTAQGRYEIYCTWESGDAHVFIVERQKDGNLLWFDPQSSHRGSWTDFDDNYINKMKSDSIGVLRIDDKLINPVFSARFKKSDD